jgi:hypothetical protein
VDDLKSTVRWFQNLGFAIKPGRPHKNSIANRHIKFVDGTELELITATEPRDSLAAEYLRYASRGDGGAFVALRVRSADSLAARLQELGLPGKLSRSMGMRAVVFPEAHPLRPLWFLEFLRPYRDLPQYTNHANGALRLRAVWLSSAIEADVERLLQGLGIGMDAADWPLPGSRVASLADPEVDDAGNPETGKGEIYVVPQEPSPRALIGVTLEVRNLEEMELLLQEREVSFTRHTDPRGKSLRLKLAGTRIEFLQSTDVPPEDPLDWLRSP